MNLEEARKTAKEQERISALIAMVPNRGGRALDAGARDGYLSTELAEHFESVVSLDLEKPNIDHPRIIAVQGDITDLSYADDEFDLVLCAEVLEHIPQEKLQRACDELARVTKGSLIIGVPFDQDLRVGQTQCSECGKTNPPWGHINSFDKARLLSLFPSLSCESTQMIGQNNACTSWLATALMSYAGNPFGSYDQDEACVYCDRAIAPPGDRNIAQKLATRTAFILNSIQQRLQDPRPDWIHVIFRKK